VFLDAFRWCGGGCTHGLSLVGSAASGALADPSTTQNGVGENLGFR
jgi:hypothetical protein